MFHLPTLGLKDLDAHCSNVLLYMSYNKDSTKQSTFPFSVSIHQYLDNPLKLKPICQLDWLWEIMDRVRVTFSPIPPTVISDEQIAAIGVSWMEAIVKPCDYVQDRTDKTFCLHCILKNSYSSWKAFFPLIGNLSYGALYDLLTYRSHLQNYEGSFNYDDIFPAVPLENDRPDKNTWKLGRKEFVSIGDIWIDKSIWKVFWLAVRRVYPPIEKNYRFGLTAHYVSTPLPSFKITMIFFVQYKEFKRYVVIPTYGNFWSALSWLFDHPPSHCEMHKVSPFYWMEGKPIQVETDTYVSRGLPDAT